MKSKKNVNIEKIKSQKTTKELLEFGIINIDKPSGPTSFDVSDFVRKTLGINKTSHFGTLDPKVTGVLPIALNRGCKLTGFFLGEDKEYVGIMRIHEDVELKRIKEAISKNFTGKIIQKPPVRSNVKRQEREREIKSFELIEKEEKNILFTTEVQGGTYIRKLVDDLGRDLGAGAHMLELRRIRAGIFNEDDKKYPSTSLYDFEKAVKEYKSGNEELLREMVIPGEVVMELFPVVLIKESSCDRILHGSPVYIEDLNNPREERNIERVCLFSEKRFVGIYSVVKTGRIFAKPDFVFQPI